MRKLSLLFLLLGASLSQATTWFVDSQATGTNNGTSWANAWTSLSSASGASVLAGDTVYISGGPSGSTRTYALGGSGWTPKNGSAGGGRITYQIGQDALHNGTAVFTSSSVFIAGTGRKYLNIVGDAGDGQRHFSVQNSSGQNQNMFDPNLMDHVRIGYVNFNNVLGSQPVHQYDVTGESYGPGNEFDHNYANYVASDGDVFFYVQTASGSSYTDNLIHDNYIRCISSGIGGAGNYGTDAFSISGQGNFSFYNNVLEGFVGTYNSTQHPDGIQCVQGSHIRVYNNYINSFDDIGIYFGARTAGVLYSDVAIYNNVVVNARMGIEFGGDTPSNSTFNNCIIANNTIAITRTQESALAACWFSRNAGPNTNCIMRNNAVVYGVIEADFGTEDHNKRYISADNAAHVLVPDPGKFVAWSTGLNGDWHLRPTATDLIDQGSSAGLTAYFTTDRDGNPRTGTWDIGAYEFGSAVADTTPPTISSATIVPAGNQVTVNFSEAVQFGAAGSGGWTTTLSGGAATMTYQSGTGTSSILFNLSRVVSSGETGTIAYSQPAGAWQDLATPPNSLASVVGFSVANSSTQGPPTLTSATISPTGTQIALVFNQSVQAGAGGNAGWTLNVSPAATLGTVTGVGSNTLTYNITGRVINTGESLTLSYVQPGDGIEAVSSHADLASITNRAVTNSSTQGQTATPQITLPAGPYFGPQSTTITDSDSGAGAVIHYTTDGSTPTGSSPVYSSPISIATNQTIKAIATWSGHVNSGIASSAYEVVSWVSPGTAFKTFSVPQQTGTFTWNVSATAPATGSDCTFGIGPTPISAYSQLACSIEFNGTTINGLNGAAYTTGPAFTSGTIYNFVATINMTAHTWSLTVTPAAGGTTTTILTNAAFRTGHSTDSQLSSIGMNAASGAFTLSNMSFPSGASSARYIGLRGVPASGGAVP